MPSTAAPSSPLMARLGEAPVGGGFAMADHWVWCGSVIALPDAAGRPCYHLFASAWPRAYPFYQGYLARSRIVRAVSDRPVGPFRFAQDLWTGDDPKRWDGRIAHNPAIVRFDGRFYLFYIGATYEGEGGVEQMWAWHRERDAGRNGRVPDWFDTIRIGVAEADRIEGPWRRPSAPTLDANPRGWDRNLVTNPAPAIGPDRRVYLYYRSSGTRIGLAIADHPRGPYRRVGEGPVVNLGEGLRVEDLFVWWSGGQFEMVLKDLTGKVTGEFHAAIHLTSIDGIDWSTCTPRKAWSRRVRWDEGTVTEQGNLERPWLLIEDGEPTCLYAATSDGPGPRDGRPGFNFATRTWNMAIPIRPPSASQPD